jgi:hypothetical protein
MTDLQMDPEPYEAPQIEDRQPIDLPLIGQSGACASFSAP